MGLGAPSDTAYFELGLMFDLTAAKKIQTNYGKLTLHAIFTKVLVSLHNMLKINFFYQICFTQLLWTLETNLPPKTEIFVARLDSTTKRLKHLNTVIYSSVYRCCQMTQYNPY